VATFVLIHGAGDVGWYWHLVAVQPLILVVPTIPAPGEAPADY
jgi:hypothetical protein